MCVVGWVYRCSLNGMTFCPLQNMFASDRVIFAAAGCSAVIVLISGTNLCIGLCMQHTVVFKVISSAARGLVRCMKQPICLMKPCRLELRSHLIVHAMVNLFRTSGPFPFPRAKQVCVFLSLSRMKQSE
jgi:hypothetical protein